MANPLPNEKELYEQIKKENITVSADIWDLLYNRIGDDISSINLLCQYYLNENQPIPTQEAGKILSYTRHIKDIINDITLISKDNFPFPEFSESIPLHPILREMFNHYIRNDIHGLNLILGYYLDPIGPEPIPSGDIQKILNHTRSIREFMNRLQQATSQKSNVSLSEPEDEQQPQSSPTEQTKEEILLKLRSLLAKEFKLNEEKIKPESRFDADLGLDSVDFIEVIMVIEDTYNFEILDDEAEKILTLAQAVDYIYNKLKS